MCERRQQEASRHSICTKYSYGDKTKDDGLQRMAACERGKESQSSIKGVKFSWQVKRLPASLKKTPQFLLKSTFVHIFYAFISCFHVIFF